MSLDRLLESPDKFQNRFWNDVDAVCWFAHDGNVYYSRFINHPVMMEEINQWWESEKGLHTWPKKVQVIGQLTEPKVEVLIKSFDENNGKSPRYWAELSGRLWTGQPEEGDSPDQTDIWGGKDFAPALMSFWQYRKDAVANWKYVSALLKKFRIAPEKVTYDFLDYGRGLDYDEINSPEAEVWDSRDRSSSNVADEPQPRSREEIDKLMTIQHTVPAAKAALGKEGAGSVKRQRVATAAGFKSPAEHGAQKVIGDSL